MVDVIMQLIPEEEDGLFNASAIKTVYVGFWKNRFGVAGKKFPIALHGAYQRFLEGV